MIPIRRFTIHDSGLCPVTCYRICHLSLSLLLTIHDLRFTIYELMQTAHNWHLKFWRLPHLDNLELLHASRVTHDYPRHMHEEYSIALILQGTETTTCRGTSHRARSGHLLLINAEEVHSNKSAGSEYRLIKVHPKTLRHVARDLGEHTLAAPYFPKLVVKDPLLFRRLLDLHLKLEQNISALEHESVFLSTIGLLLTRLNKNYCAPRSIAKAGAKKFMSASFETI